MNWHQGFWRFTLVIWLLGLSLLAALAALNRPSSFQPAFHRPFERFHPDGEFPPCAAEDRTAGTICFNVFEDVAEHERALSRWESEHVLAISLPSYWKELGKLVAILGAWSVLLWGVFYALVWVLRGFRPGEPAA